MGPEKEGYAVSAVTLEADEMYGILIDPEHDRDTSCGYLYYITSVFGPLGPTNEQI